MQQYKGGDMSPDRLDLYCVSRDGLVGLVSLHCQLDYLENIPLGVSVRISGDNSISKKEDLSSVMEEETHGLGSQKAKHLSSLLPDSRHTKTNFLSCWLL